MRTRGPAGAAPPVARRGRADRRRSTALLAAAAAAIATAAVAAPDATAQVRTIGANLDRPATAPYGCETLPTTDFAGNRAFLPSGAGTCTYVATGGLGNFAEVAQAPPGGGLVTRVRVRAGPVVGPMQVTVSRAMRSTTPGIGFACCFFAGASQAFVPRPNAVTQVGVRLPVRSDLDPQVGETVDYLGITVLAPGVPIPAQEIGSPGNIQNPGAIGFFPHLRPEDSISGRVDGAGIGGVVPLLSADVLPFCGPGAALATAGAAQAGGCAPFLALGAGGGRVAAGRVALALVCNAPVPCAGRLLLQSRRAAVAAAAVRRRPVTYASARVAIPAAGAATATPKLSRAGRRLMSGRRRARAWMNARLTNGAVVAHVSRRVRLRR
jgi:hypothetical protein